MRISDWSSDVCSSDLSDRDTDQGRGERRAAQPVAVADLGGGRQRGAGRLVAAVLSLHPATARSRSATASCGCATGRAVRVDVAGRSEEHTSELQSLMRISYAVFCFKKKNNKTPDTH